MKRFVRLTLLSAVAAGLAACGGGAKLGGGKEGAAQAAFQASQPVGSFAEKSQQRLIDQALASGALSVSAAEPCPHGGEIKVAVDLSDIINGEPGYVRFAYDATYDACNMDGKNEYNGTMKTTVTFEGDTSTTGASVNLIYKLDGKLTVEGEINDFVDADNLTMTLSATANSATEGASVNMTLNGTIQTSSETHVYTNDAIDFTVGELPTT